MGCPHRSPVGERAAAGTGDLPCQQLDDAVVLSVVVRFHDSVSVVDRSSTGRYTEKAGHASFRRTRSCSKERSETIKESL